MGWNHQLVVFSRGITWHLGGVDRRAFPQPPGPCIDWLVSPWSIWSFKKREQKVGKKKVRETLGALLVQNKDHEEL